MARTLIDDGPLGRSLAVIFLVAAWVLTWRPQNDPDAWWHLVIGGRVLAGDIPRTETISWINAGDPFLAHSWLWDVALRVAYDVAGLMGTSLVGIAVTALILALLWLVSSQTAPALPPLPRASLIAAATVVALPVWGPRAQLWDLVSLLALVAAWGAYLRGGRGIVLAVVPLVTVVWANVHGSGVAAYPFLVALLIAAIVVGVRWGVWERPAWLPLILSSLVGLVAIALNPYGPGLLLYPYDGVVASAFNPAIDEWRSPDFSAFGLQPLRLVLATVVIWATALRARARDPLILILAAALTFQALGSVRFVLLAGPLVVLAAAPGLASVLDRWVSHPARPAHRQASAGRAAVLVGGIAAIGISAVLIIGGFRLLEPAAQDVTVNGRFPVAATRALLADECHGRVLNAYDWGGYLAFWWGDEVGAYGNSPGSIVGVQAALESLDSDPRLFLDDNEVDLIMIKAESPMARWMRHQDGWDIQFEDAIAITWRRAGSGVCAA